MPFVVPEEENSEESEHLTQAEWWELLFFIKKLTAADRQQAVQFLQDSLGREVGTSSQVSPAGLDTFGKLGRGSGGPCGGGGSGMFRDASVGGLPARRGSEWYVWREPRVSLLIRFPAR